MDKYEQLKDNIKKEIAKIKNRINDINTSLLRTTTDDIEELNELFDNLNYNCDEFRGYYDRYCYVLTHELQIKAMLNDFYDRGNILYSFTYTCIKKINCKETTEYCVNDKCFNVLEEAKEYSKSLGETTYWLYRVYDYLNMNC